MRGSGVESTPCPGRPILSAPSPHLPDELGIKWGANKFECLRLLWPNRLPNLFEYHLLSPHFSFLFEHQDRERLLTFRFGRFGDGVTNGLRRLETMFDPPPVYDDLSEDHRADPPVEDYESLYESFLAQYEAALGAHEFRGKRRVDPHPESEVCLLNARDLAYWPLPSGRLQVALLLSQSKPAWNEPQWIGLGAGRLVRRHNLRRGLFAAGPRRAACSNVRIPVATAGRCTQGICRTRQARQIGLWY